MKKSAKQSEGEEREELREEQDLKVAEKSDVVEEHIEEQKATEED